MSSDPDHLYLDLSVINNDNTGSRVKTNLNFTELRNMPFLNNPDNYYLGICRFEVDTPGFSLPQFIPVLLLDGNNTNINKTIYTITMARVVAGQLVNCTPVNVLWSPEDLNAPLPNNSGTPFNKQDLSTGYYNCYSVKWWINCINTALVTCWLALQVGNTADTAPFLTIDPLTNIVTLYTPKVVGFTNTTFAANTASSSGFTNPANPNLTTPVFLNTALRNAIFFNEPLLNLLSSLPSVAYESGNYDLIPSYFDAPSYVTYLARPYLFNYYIQPTNYNNLNQLVTAAATYCITKSDYSPVPLWNPVAQIVFSSALLPLSVALTSIPSAYNSNPFDLTFANGGGGNNANVNSMLTDIEVGLVSGNEYKPSVLYAPQNEYRLVDLFGLNPLSQASFSISYRTKFGVNIPFRLGAQQGANIKLLFRRKRFNLNNLAPYNYN